MEEKISKLVKEIVHERKDLIFQSDGLPRPSINKPLIDKMGEIALKLINIVEEG